MKIPFFHKKNSIYIGLGLGIILLFWITRLFNLDALPIFTDEAIYVRWAQIAKNDANWRFISLTDGKQPSFVWVAMVLMRFFHDPLIASRMVSVIFGFATLAGLFFLGREIFKSTRVGLISSFLYVIFPMALVYDRMALYDSMVGTFTIWSLFLAVLLIRYVRLDAALLLGMVAGGGALTKSNAFFSIYLLPFTLILFNFHWKDKVNKLIQWVAYACIAAGITYGMYSILRLSPFFHIITGKNALFVYPLHDWLDHPFTFLLGNLSGMFDWVITYLTISIVFLIIASFFIEKRFIREKILLTLYFFVPCFITALFGRVLYPRFVLFMILPLLPMAAMFLDFLLQNIKHKILNYALILVILFLPLRSNFYILTNFSKSPIPYVDIQQYYNDWTSGYGVKETVKFFQEEAKDKKIYVATQGTFGLMPYALEIYLVDNPNIIISGFWPVDDKMPVGIEEARKKMPTYVVFYQPCIICKNPGFAPISWPVTIEKQFEKGHQGRYFTVYKVNQ